MVALGDTWQLGPDVMEAVKQGPAVFSRSSDRMMRAIALYTRYGRLLARPASSAKPEPIKGLPKLGKGAQPEWLGKKVLAAAGIRVPAASSPAPRTKRPRSPSASAIRW